GYAKDHGINLQIQYKGSVDIMLMLQDGAPDVDAIWPANSLWISLGDDHHLVKDAQSIMSSPVVLGVKRSVAQKLGWVGRDVRVEDILQATESSSLRLMMTSATQSNSGASAYLGFLYAFAGSPAVLTSENLNDATLQANARRLLGTVNRSSQS